jgi:hypothetical protein
MAPLEASWQPSMVAYGARFVGGVAESPEARS